MTGIPDLERLRDIFGDEALLQHFDSPESQSQTKAEELSPLGFRPGRTNEARAWQGLIGNFVEPNAEISGSQQIQLMQEYEAQFGNEVPALTRKQRYSVERS